MMQFKSSKGTTFTNRDGRGLRLQIYLGKIQLSQINKFRLSKKKEEEEQQSFVLHVLPEHCNDQGRYN